MITGKSYKSYMTLYDYREKWISRTHSLVDSGVFFTKRALYLLQMESLTHLTLIFFFYETCMITGKSYKSYMPMYDYRENETQQLIVWVTLVCVFLLLKERYTCYDWSR